MDRYTPVILAISLLSLVADVTAFKRQILSTVIYTRYGDRTPFVLSSSPKLTPLGAEQLYQAGGRIRSMYIDPFLTSNETDTSIRGISPTLLVNSQMSILSTSDQYVAASAQAFMQGLYPPLSDGGNLTYIDGSFILANGSVIAGPLDGIQYPVIRTASSADVRSIWVQGSANCGRYTNAMIKYYNTSTFAQLQQGTQSLYEKLDDEYLNAFFADEDVGYHNAFYIWEYLNYAYQHDASLARSIDPADLTAARILANDLEFALYANTTSSGRVPDDHLQAIAGRTLANRVLRALRNSINSRGRLNKINLMFGSFEPMISFAALARLMVPQHATFYSIPAEGSSFIFELSSLVPDTDSGNYPNSSDIYVRFLYMNGTDQYSTLTEYPLFGNGPSQARMTLADFTSSMQKIMIDDEKDWCTTCASDSIFCPFYTGVDGGSTHSGGLSPVVGGVIGALVTLFCAITFVCLAMFFGGVRMQRIDKGRRSKLGGFKGSEKLASDQDLTLSKGGAGVAVTESIPDDSRTHERIGSWELREQAKNIEQQSSGLDMKGTTGDTRRPSYEEDDIHISPFATPVRPKDQF